MKKLIAGNWKMNGTMESALALGSSIVEAIQADPQILERCDFVVCPPSLYIVPVETVLTQAVSLGAQDCAATDNGAYTGDLSAAMLHNVHCDYVILGHSERRQYHAETDTQVAAKAEAAHGKGLITIICVGETEAQRDANKQYDIVGAQLEAAIPASSSAQNTVIAYEPVWAIGTGKTASTADIQAMHAFIRETMAKKLAGAEKLRILYGGSVKPDNAADIFAVENVDGALIGGASLKTNDYMAIARGVK